MSATEPLAVMEHQIALLGELAELGMAMARRTACADNTDETAPAHFAKLARAIRLSLMLQARLSTELQSARHDATTRSQFDRKRQVRRIVERIAQREGFERADTLYLSQQAYDRVDHEDLYGDALDQPLSDLITLICKDLGLAPDWADLRNEAWAQQEPPSTNLNSFPPRVAPLRGPRGEAGRGTG
jgi:hypothetical protein